MTTAPSAIRTLEPLGVILLGFGWLVGCGASAPDIQHPETSDPEVIDMEGLRIQANRGDAGLEFETYDAAQLFHRATELVNSEECEAGAELYDRLFREFPHSRFSEILILISNVNWCINKPEFLFFPHRRKNCLSQI